MKVIYGEPTVCDQLDILIADASQPIKEIQLTAKELQEYCERFGYAFSKQCGYDYKGYRIVYDWGRYE